MATATTSNNNSTFDTAIKAIIPVIMLGMGSVMIDTKSDIKVLQVQQVISKENDDLTRVAIKELTSAVSQLKTYLEKKNNH